MKYQEAMEYIEACAGYGIVPGLDTIRELLFRLGNPERELSFIHIAGTNGKGSTLFFVSNILAANGYRVGRYLSPTIFEYRERFQMNGKPISKAAFGRLTERVAEAAEAMAAKGHPHPTPFEIDTALAFLYFKEKNCDFVVLETGLGGLMDATNVVENTRVTILTSISRDHMAFLGESLAEIAAQKAGIIKKASYVVALEGEPEVEEVIREAVEERQAKEVSFVHKADLRNCHYGLEKQRFSYKNYKQMEITLAGQYQLVNAALALEAVEALKKQGVSLKEEKIRQGLAVGNWPARFQILQKKPYFIVDGAHNEGAAKELRKSLEFYFTNKRILYIMGMFRDKECAKVIDLTCDLADHIITVQAKGNSRALPALELATLISEKHPKVTVADSVEEAVELSLLLADKDTVIVAFGSLAYLGDCIRAVEQKE